MEQRSYATQDGEYDETVGEPSHKMKRRRTTTFGRNVYRIPESKPSAHCLSPMGKSSHVAIEIVLQEKKCCTGKSNIEM